MADQLGKTGSIHDALRTATLVQGAGGPGGAIGSHNMLSATHLDTTPASVARGALVTGQGATPKWTLLAHPGTAWKFLMTNATDVAWSTGSLLFWGVYTLDIRGSGTAALMNVLNTGEFGATSFVGSRQAAGAGIVFHHGSRTGLWYTILEPSNLTADRYVTFPNSDLNFSTISSGWSVTAGYTADKAFDPESTTDLEIGRVLGTLVDTLKTYGLLGA